MKMFYWLNLFGSILLMVLLGPFIKSRHAEINGETSEKSRGGKTFAPHAFLLGQKISVRAAKVAELAMVQGISLAGAWRIRKFLQENPHKGFMDLEELPGIGPKALEKLREYFY